MGVYQNIYEKSLAEPEQFWGQQAENIVWIKKPEQVYSKLDGQRYRWFAGGELNTCYNAVDRHVDEGYGEQLGLIYDSPLAGTQEKFTYAQMVERISKIAGALLRQGVTYGDRVIIYMPLIPDAVFSMLACARIGAVHSVVFGGFGSEELASRIDDAKAKVILSASCGFEPNRIIDYHALLSKAKQMSTHQPDCCVFLQRERQVAKLQEHEIDWDQFIDGVEPAECVAVKSEDPLYILYTSGTTGRPKGIVRDNGGHAVALKWTMPNIYDVKPGEVYWSASDIGWIVGHSYIVYATLLNRNTTVLYEGKPAGTPDAGAFWRVIAEHKVNCMFTAPTAIRAIKKEDSLGQLIKNYDISALRSIYLAGERCDPDSIQWLENHTKVQVIDHWWQTETGWAICANPAGIEILPKKTGSTARPMPGYQLRVLDEQGEQKECGELGNLAIKLPMPPSSFYTLWGDHERYVSDYLSKYPGYYLTGDSGIIDADGDVHVMSRVDDVINVAAHRLSTGQMEEVLCRHPDVVEAAVFGLSDSFKGQIPIGLVLLNDGTIKSEADIKKELILAIRDSIGPVASFNKVEVVKRLPKTRSGKILRGTLRKMANGEPYTVPATIDDPKILEEIEQVLEGMRA